MLQNAENTLMEVLTLESGAEELTARDGTKYTRMTKIGIKILQIKWSATKFVLLTLGKDKWFYPKQ